MLMALEGDKPILVIVPKTLIWQWQDEMLNLLDMPSAVWNGKCWVDENKIEYPAKEEFALSRCPRKVGIISQGLIVRSRAKVAEQLMKLNYECIIVDESHRARRNNAGNGKENDSPQPNNLMGFLIEIAQRTRSMLLATATPVQLHPIEAWDLLYILSQGNDFVLGDHLSHWQSEANKSLHLVTGREELDSDYEKWDWLRNPFPSSDENPKTFGVLRRHINLPADKFVISGSALNSFTPQQKAIVNRYGFTTCGTKILLKTEFTDYYQIVSETSRIYLVRYRIPWKMCGSKWR